MTRHRSARGRRAARRANRPTVARRIVAVLALAGLALVGFAPLAPTSAGWSTPVKATGGLSALTVPKATISTCSVSGGLLFPTITIGWNAPTGYTKANAEFGTDQAGSIVALAAGSVTTNGTTNPYSTAFTGALVSGLINGTRTVAVRIVQPGSTWSSAWATGAGSMNFLGFGLGCVIG